ncbi:MAG: hypothetical protein ACXVGN_00155 [Mycobacteriaceae bacterium]
MTTFEQFWPAVQNIVTQVANEYGRRNRIHGADPDDYGQELVVWLIENQDQVAAWFEELEPKEFEKYVAQALRNQSADYSLDIKAQATGYERSDLYFYTKGELKSLLPAVFDESKWLEPPQSEGRSTKAQSEGNNWVTTLADVSRALGTLHADDRDILTAVYKDGWTNSLLADMTGTSEANASWQHDRAITRLQQALGGGAPEMRAQETRDPWRGRHSLGNSQARAMTGADYEQ